MKYKMILVIIICIFIITGCNSKSKLQEKLIERDFIDTTWEMINTNQGTDMIGKYKYKFYENNKGIMIVTYEDDSSNKDWEITWKIDDDYIVTYFQDGGVIDRYKLTDKNILISSDETETYKKVITAVDALITKSNSTDSYENGNKNEMYKFTHNATTQTKALVDYRYIGNEPYNYVDFDGEIWRIIGVFTVEDETGIKKKRIKLIKNESLEKEMSWTSNNNNSYGSSLINKYLNNDYYETLSFKKYIVNTKFYLGSYNREDIDGSKFYEFERGENACYNNDNYSTNIGLIYPSDFVYTYALGVNDECYNNPSSSYSTFKCKEDGWLYTNKTEWTITQSNYTNTSCYLIYIISDYGAISVLDQWDISWAIEHKSSYASAYVRPVVYLDSSIRIISGNGSKDNPYHLAT